MERELFNRIIDDFGILFFYDALVSLYKNIFQHIDCNKGRRYGNRRDANGDSWSVSSSASTTNVKRDNSTVQKNVTANSTYYKWDMIYDKIGKDTGEPFDEVVSTHVHVYTHSFILFISYFNYLLKLCIQNYANRKIICI